MFKRYLENGSVKRKTPDLEEAQSLFRQALDRMTYARSKDISQTTAKFVFEDAYEAVREAGQSLMSLRGFKPYSHAATIEFLKEFYDFTEEDISEFHRFRELRNASVYKAAPISVEEAESILRFAESIIEKIEATHDNGRTA